MHVPCPNCHTGWLMPEAGEDHLRRCPVCQGTGYITANSGRRREDNGQDPFQASPKSDSAESRA